MKTHLSKEDQTHLLALSSLVERIADDIGETVFIAKEKGLHGLSEKLANSKSELDVGVSGHLKGFVNSKGE